MASAAPPSYDEALQVNSSYDSEAAVTTRDLAQSSSDRQPESLTTQLSKYILPPSYESLFGRNNSPPQHVATIVVPRQDTEFTPSTSLPAYTQQSGDTSTVVLPESCIQQEPAPADNEQNQGIDGLLLCCSSKERCKETLKKIGKLYAAAGYLLTMPVCIAMIVIANMDDPQQRLRPTERPSVMSTSHSLFLNTSWQDDEEDVSQCRALPSLPRNMVASGAVGLAVWVVLFVTTFCENGADKRSIGNRLGNRQKSGSFLWVAGVILMIAFYFRGSIDAYKVWTRRPDCNPFELAGCPISYCNTRVMYFSILFYPISMVLLTPVWCIIVAIIGYILKSLACSIVRKQASI